MFAVLVAVLFMIPFTLRLTARDRQRSRGLRWQGIDWERVREEPLPDDLEAPQNNDPPQHEEKVDP